jgi:hypothetical protein
MGFFLSVPPNTGEKFFLCSDEIKKRKVPGKILTNPTKSTKHSCENTGKNWEIPPTCAALFRQDHP